MTDLKPCPFCGGKAKISFKDYRFIGYNWIGDRKVMYRVQVICNKCRSRGKPIITPGMVNPNPYISKWGNCYYEKSERGKKETEMFEPYVHEAIEHGTGGLKMTDLIDRAELYKHIAELEELARNRVCDTPSNSPAYMRYVAQLNERTYLKHKVADAPTIDPVHAAGACYCLECRNYNKPRLGWCSHHMDRENPDDFCSWGKRMEDTK